MIPEYAKIFPLTPGTKFPATKHGHHDAQLYTASTTPPGNYGIALDEQYLVVDFDVDHPEREAFEASLPPTWSQKTGGKSPNGIHYLYTLPEGYTNKESSFKASDGTRIADIKTKGYIVGPGSVVNAPYTMLSKVQPVLVPANLITKKRVSKNLSTSIDFGGVPKGEHDNFIISLNGWARKNWSLDEDALIRLQDKGVLGVLQDMDPNDPYTIEHFRDKARRASLYAGEKPLELIEEGWDPVTNTEMSRTAWLLQDFIPRGELVLQYGAGGIGKSTWISWLAAQAARKGLTFGVASIEEPVKRFKVRAHLSDKSLGMKVHNIVDLGNTWKFPKDALKFRAKLEKYPLDIVYFDSIYAHFENSDSFGNTAEKARACLSPLAVIAQELGVTIIGTFHENKAKEYLGSTEMLNVSRVVLHATRVGGKSLRVSVKKTNFNQPDYALNMLGGYQGAESVEGKLWLEESEDGVVSQTLLYVVSECARTTGAEEIEYTLESVRDDEYDEILAFLRENPRVGRPRIVAATGISDAKVKARLEKIKLHYPELVNSK